MSEALQQLILQAEAQKLQIEMQILFEKNMALLKKRAPRIFKLMDGYQAQEWKLKLGPNSELNLYNENTKTLLYNSSPTGFSRKQTDHFKKHSKVRRLRVSKNRVINQDHLHIKHLNGIVDAYEAEGEAPRISETPEFIPTLIVSGVGLGYHLMDLIKNHDIQNILIYENCKDTFFGSLHVIPWQEIFDYFSEKDRSFTLCVGVTPNMALSQIESALHRTGMHAQMFTFVYRHTMRKTDLDFIDFYQNQLRAYIGGIGYFDDEQIGLAHGYHNIKSDIAVFVSKQTHRRKTRLILIGNGPSLDLHKDYIEENRDSAIIMSCGSALGSLLKMGIKPDFHVEMERCVMVNDILNYNSTADDREGIILLCLHTVSPDTIRAFDDGCIGVKPNDAGASLVHDYCAPQKVQELIHCNPTVVNCGLSFATSMGFETIHLVGVDFGSPDSKSHHSKHSVYADIEKHLKDEKEQPVFFDKETAIENPGNFGGQVYSSPVLNMAKVSMERYLQLIKPAFPNLRILNSNQGVLIDGTEPIELSSIGKDGVIDKPKEIQDIKQSHFHYQKNAAFERKEHTEFLKHFFKHEKDFTLSPDIKSDRDLYMEMRRAYKTASIKDNRVTHFLLKGSLNSFFGAIVEHTMYCKDQEEFKKRAVLGIALYNDFIKAVFEKMRKEPFVLDATNSPAVKDMVEKREKEAQKH